MYRLLSVILMVFFLGCSNEYTTDVYIQKKCLGNIQDFNENILQKKASYALAYFIENESAKIKFAGHDIKTIIITGDPLLGRVITSDGGNYFAFALDNDGKIEYEFNPDKWFVGTCK